MNNYLNKLKYLFLLAPAIWIGCNDGDEEDPLLPSDFENGVFITNEGNFGSANGSLSFYDFDGEKAYNSVYSLANESMDLGDVVQSIHLGADRAYLVVNNSNKVEALNLNNAVIDYVISDVSLPRYMTNNGGNGYISEWVSFTDKGRVSVVDLSSGAVTNTIETDFGAEGVIIAGTSLFVSNNFTTTVSIIDLASESVTKTLDVASSPGLMQLDADGDIWLVCGGGSDPDTFAPLGDGKLFEIDPSSYAIKQSIELGMNVSTKTAVDPEGETLYYFAGTSIYAFDVSQSSAPSAPLISESEAIGFYGIGVDDMGMIYAGDSKAFDGDGEVFVYEPNGTLSKRFGAGIGPNGFAFN